MLTSSSHGLVPQLKAMRNQIQVAGAQRGASDTETMPPSIQYILDASGSGAQYPTFSRLGVPNTTVTTAMLYSLSSIGPFIGPDRR